MNQQQHNNQTQNEQKPHSPQAHRSGDMQELGNLLSLVGKLDSISSNLDDFTRLLTSNAMLQQQHDKSLRQTVTLQEEILNSMSEITPSVKNQIVSVTRSINSLELTIGGLKEHFRELIDSSQDVYAESAENQAIAIRNLEQEVNQSIGSIKTETKAFLEGFLSGDSGGFGTAELRTEMLLSFKETSDALQDYKNELHKIKTTLNSVTNDSVKTVDNALAKRISGFQQAFDKAESKILSATNLALPTIMKRITTFGGVAFAVASVIGGLLGITLGYVMTTNNISSEQERKIGAYLQSFKSFDYYEVRPKIIEGGNGQLYLRVRGINSVGQSKHPASGVIEMPINK